MTGLFLLIKHRCPFVWRLAERINGTLFGILYPHLRSTAYDVLHGHTAEITFSPVEESDLHRLHTFLTRQPEERLACFAPHGFDMPTLRRLYRNKAFLMMKATASADNTMVGYFFLRCFFIGRAFHGLLVADRCSCHGIGSRMWRLAAIICRKQNIRMFATISERNTASLRSCAKGTDMRVVRRLHNGYLLVECNRKHDNG